MGANLNTTEKSLFIIDKPYWKNEAIATGAPYLAETIVFNPIMDVMKRDSKKYTWMVCPHLSQPDLVYRYYVASGLITIVLGKCLVLDVCFFVTVHGLKFEIGK